MSRSNVVLLSMAGDTTIGGANSADDTSPSGRFVLRLPPSLHARLRNEAGDSGVSLNELCVKKLGAAPCDLPEAFRDLVSAAKVAFGADLVGVILYGSWARGDATNSSDIDMMIVLDSRVPLNMQLYEGWVEREWKVGSHGLEVHFAHLPSAAELPSGLWAEISLDGRVIYESELAVTRTLATVRRRIAAGELVRRTSHGQPYWVEGSSACAT